MRYENEYPDEEVLELISRQKELNFEPGEEYLYSNTGYLLLGEIVKRVSGKSLRAFADECIFAPLGMKKTHYHDDFTEIVKDRAVGYSTKRTGASGSICPYSMWWETAAFTPLSKTCIFGIKISTIISLEITGRI